MSKVHLNFSDNVKKCWTVKHDNCFDEYLVLNGKNALGKGGLDHIYLISSNKAGLWLTGKQVKQKINTIQKKVPSLMIEQLGDGEAVLSVPFNDLHDLCEAVRARKRKQLSEEQIQKLRNNLPFQNIKKEILI